MPNLEYWQYLDRPDLFAAYVRAVTVPVVSLTTSYARRCTASMIQQTRSNECSPFFGLHSARILNSSCVLCFCPSTSTAINTWPFLSWTPLCHTQHGKVCKPYNSVLGEHFRAHWTVKAVTYPSDPTEPPICHTHLQTSAPSVAPSEAASFKSSSSKRSKGAKTNGDVTPGSGDLRTLGKDLSRVSLGGKSLTDADSTLALDEGSNDGETVRVVFLVSAHLSV